MARKKTLKEWPGGPSLRILKRGKNREEKKGSLAYPKGLWELNLGTFPRCCQREKPRANRGDAAKTREVERRRSRKRVTDTDWDLRRA